MVFNLMLKFLRSPFWLGLAHFVVEKNPLEYTGEKEPPHVKIDEILKVDYHANEYNDGTGLPCVRVKVSYNSRKDVCEFKIFTYLDFERRFIDPLEAVKRIITSVPCTKITNWNYYDSWDAWAIPNKYRTQWGVVELVRMGYND